MPFHSDLSLSQPWLRFGSFNHVPLRLGHLFLLRCTTTRLAPSSAIGVTAQASFVHAPCSGLPRILSHVQKCGSSLNSDRGPLAPLPLHVSSCLLRARTALAYVSTCYMVTIDQRMQPCAAGYSTLHTFCFDLSHLDPAMPLRSKVRLCKFPPSALISPRLQGPSWSQPNRHVQSLSRQTSRLQPQLHFDRCPYDTTFIHCNHAYLLFAAL
jgi:hypothetical protein